MGDCGFLYGSGNIKWDNMKNVTDDTIHHCSQGHPGLASADGFGPAQRLG
jgi:hypothetical protein